MSDIKTPRDRSENFLAYALAFALIELMKTHSKKDILSFFDKKKISEIMAVLIDTQE